MLKGSTPNGSRAQELTDNVQTLAGRIAQLEQRLGAFERVAAHLDSLHQRAEVLGQNQQRTDDRMRRALADTERIRTILDQINPKAELAFRLMDRMDVFLNMEKPLEQLRVDAEDLRVQLDSRAEQLEQLRQQHDRVVDGHKTAFGKLESFDRVQETLGRTLEHSEKRVAAVEQALRQLDNVEPTVDDVRRRLAEVGALGGALAQKVAELEGQRGAVQRAIDRAENLEETMRRVDAGMRQQHEAANTLAAIQEQVAMVQTLQEAVLHRSREIEDVHRTGDEQLQAMRSELAAARDEFRSTGERFNLDRHELESITQRVDTLRAALSQLETRFPALSEAHQAVDELTARTQTLKVQLQYFSGEISKLEQHAVAAQAIRQRVDEAGGAIQAVEERALRIEEARASIEAVSTEVERLRGAHALVRDALEQSQVAATEIARLREDQAQTRSWLAEVDQKLRELREGAAELQKVAPTLELVQQQAQRASDTVAAIESRREFVDQVHRRLIDLEALSAAQDERGRALQAQAEAVQQRFSMLEGAAAEAERLGRTVTSLSAGLADAQNKADAIAGRVAAVDERCRSAEALADRTRTLHEGLEQRQHALEEISKDLGRVSELRQEAALAAQDLDQRAHRVIEVLSDADRQATRVDVLSRQIEERAARLQLAEERINQFEHRLDGFKLVEQEITRSLEQLAARQGTIETLQSDVGRMFTVVEQTAASVRGITSARVEIEEGQKLLEKVMERVRALRDSETALDQRQRQMTQAEERLARADALLADVRRNLELLHGHKAVVDQAVERTGALRALLKQAEGMIEELRDAREMAVRVRDALAGEQSRAEEAPTGAAGTGGASAPPGPGGT